MSKALKDRGRIRGMFRLNIVEDQKDGTQKIVGDSGWHENLITNVGFLNMVNQMGTGLTGGKIQAAALGTGTSPGATDTTQSGELTTSGTAVARAALTAATSSTSKTLHQTATFASGVFTASANISNIGLWTTSATSTNSGTLVQENTYTSSSLATNQAVNISYDLIFS